MTAIDRRTMMLGAALSTLGTRAWSETFPARPIKVIVPFGAGGSGDMAMGALSPVMERQLGQHIVVEARPGSAGIIGVQDVIRANPDGYTLLLGTTNNFVINQFMFPKQPVDPLSSLTLITKLVSGPLVVYVNPGVPARTFGEFISYAKAHPGKLNFASPGVGTAPHLAVERLKQLAGIDLVHVPFHGAPEAMQALLENQVQLYLAGWVVGRSYVESGAIRALAVAAGQRLPDIPLPTSAEGGLPQYIASNWWGLAAPKGTPSAVINQIYLAAKAALADPKARSLLEKAGYLIVGDTPDAFARDAQSEAQTWSKTIERGDLAVR